MVAAWYMDDSQEDQRMPHHKEPPAFLTLDTLKDDTGVEYFKISSEVDDALVSLKKDRGYTFEDEITCSKQCLPNYEEKLKNFFAEHIHTDEEIRLVLEGSGYFDVRDSKDEWIRIQVVQGDLIIIPAGIYHRFTLDDKNFIKAKRFFIGEPVWTPHNRPADNMSARKEYLQKLASNAFSSRILQKTTEANLSKHRLGEEEVPQHTGYLYLAGTEAEYHSKPASKLT